MAQRGGQSRRVMHDGDGRAPGPLAGVRPDGRARTRAGTRTSAGILWLGVIRATTLALAAALTLAGCTATAAPAPSAPGTPGIVHPAGPTTTPSPTPTPIAPPQRPAAMDRDDAEGAIAAATYFISLYSYAYATGDLDELQAMSDPACVFCSGLTSDVQGAAASEARLVGGELTITSSAVTPGVAPNVFRVDLTVTQAPFQEINSSGTVTSSGPGTKSASVNAVLERDPTWRVRAAMSEVIEQ
ncbi:DUF6318 family protein [Pengzhenrongella phosphoraccumulans]|uniref:DUF6318 family protein n=1 Tax=Pengzhenrongella phosphoraccumulans TaxID=3114394 RepID=UPI00389080C4